VKGRDQLRNAGIGGRIFDVDLKEMKGVDWFYVTQNRIQW